MYTARLVLGLSLLSASGCMGYDLRSNLPDVGAVASPQPEIRIAPEQHDFGTPFLGCPLTHPFQIINDGDADLVVSELTFDADSSDLVFESTLTLPFTLAPGAGTEVAVSYLALDAVDDFGELVALSNDPDRPEAFAEATGAAQSAGAVRDVFEEPLQPLSDILVVVDNSCSMAEEQANLTSNFQTFIDSVVAVDADWRIAVITTDSPDFRGPVITPMSVDPIGKFTQQASVGTAGSGDEMPLQMIAESVLPGADAAPGGVFFRDDALLAVIVVTDEPDLFSPMTPTALSDYLFDLKGGDQNLVRLHTIGGDVPTPACASAAAASVPLDEAVALTAGLFLSVCGNWGNSLTAVAEGSITLLDTFALSQAPLPGTLAVVVDGTVVTSGWTFDATTQSVVFDAASIPAPGASIEVTYEPLADCSGS